MPNRMMRDSARTSTTLDRLSHGGERFFWRLILTADDFGRFHADSTLLLASCFPRRVGRIRPKQILGWRNELVTAGLIQLYEQDGRFFGYFVNWERFQRVRSRHSRFPAPLGKDNPSPPVAADGGHSPQSASERRESGVERRESGVENRKTEGKESHNESLGDFANKNRTEQSSRKMEIVRNEQQKGIAGRGKLACVLEK